MSISFSPVTIWLQHPHIGNWDFPQLFAMTPPENWEGRSLYIAFLVFCLLTILILSFIKLPGRLKSQLNSLLWFTVLTGSLFFFLRDQRIPLLGMDLWRFLLESGDAIWLVFILRYFRSTFYKEQLDHQVQAYKNRFLPKSK